MAREGRPFFFASVQCIDNLTDGIVGVTAHDLQIVEDGASALHRLASAVFKHFKADAEVEAVATYVKENFNTDYDNAIMEDIEKRATQAAASSGKGGNGGKGNAQV